ncbi:hypothetical protein SAMN05444000_10367 [Shimia gijangensis]|uniref:Uncharacterized protein n=1 Tax=Shimia gijangensis TaxID=1470563 RepID=A0A1M6E0P5_9RHOB|nr:hypothetical protein SAMN05444000_10367 [Shimia gijangensis]
MIYEGAASRGPFLCGHKDGLVTIGPHTRCTDLNHTGRLFLQRVNQTLDRLT